MNGFPGTRRGFAPACAAAVLVLVTPQLAHATFTDGALVSSAGVGYTDGPDVAVDADGDSVVVWSRAIDGYRVQARRVSATGVMGPTLTLSAKGADAHTPQVAITADGRAVVTWDRSDGTHRRIQAREISPSGTVGPVRTLSSGTVDASTARIAMDPAGDAFVVWSSSDGASARIQGRTITAGGVLGATRNLSQGPGMSTSPQVAVSADGHALVAWQLDDGTTNRVQARRLALDGTRGPLRNVSAAAVDASAPEVAVDPDGDAVLTWISPNGIHSSVMVRQMSADDVLGSKIHAISGFGSVGPGSGRVALDADGNAVVLWHHAGNPGASEYVRIRRLSASGVLSSIRGLGDADVVQSGGIAVSADGALVAVWEEWETHLNATVLWVRHLNADGSLGRRRSLATTTGASPMSPAVSGAPGGATQVTWMQQDAAPQKIMVSRGP